MRRWQGGVTTSSRPASPNSVLDRTKPAGDVSTRIPKPVHRSTYRPSLVCVAAFSKTRIPAVSGTPNCEAHKHSVSLETQSIRRQDTCSCDRPGESLIDSDSKTTHALSLREYPPASSLLYQKRLPRNLCFGLHKGHMSHTSPEETEVMLTDPSAKALGRVQMSLNSLLSSLDVSESAGDVALNAIRLKLARHRTDILGKLASLRLTIQHQMQGKLPLCNAFAVSICTRLPFFLESSQRLLICRVCSKIAACVCCHRYSKGIHNGSTWPSLVT